MYIFRKTAMGHNQERTQRLSAVWELLLLALKVKILIFVTHFSVE